MATTNPITGLFSALPQHLSAPLFANAKPIHLAADQVLFVADDPGDGCYRIEKGLVKISIVAASGAERILAFLGSGAIGRARRGKNVTRSLSNTAPTGAGTAAAMSLSL